MRYPENLPKDGTIGFLAPSFGCAIEPYKSAFQNAIKKWDSMGYHTLLGPNCYEGKGIGISNSPQKCGEEIMLMFESEADCLISCGGGELMCEVLPYVDFGKMAQLKPKWFMGYSDNTNLVFTLATLTDTAAVYAPCASSFGMEPWHESLSDAFGILKGEIRTVESYGRWEKNSLKDEEHPLIPYHLTEKLDMKCFVGSDAVSHQNAIDFQGRLLGGCLDCLVTLAGTKYDKVKEFNQKYQQDGIVWFLESCDLNVFAIRRAMWQLEQAGWFQNVKGFLIGRPANGETVMGLDSINAFMDVLGKKNVPVILDVDLGHLPPMMPVIVGSYAEVIAFKNHLSIKMTCK